MGLNRLWGILRRGKADIPIPPAGKYLAKKIRSSIEPAIFDTADDQWEIGSAVLAESFDALYRHGAILECEKSLKDRNDFKLGF